ncbi:SRPBCC family protein [Actinopolymorpha sp. B11F2]|uniref:SRPBCC family protein n=1 Tax=Actinopolymorpha sp. B11F2 TaxID=3160862 RepID=UPI0032E3703F
MIEVNRTVSLSPERVFAVLADGWSYASWVVGASHIRKVDPDWPAVGSQIHHNVGPWPLVIQDATEVLAMEVNSLLEVHARIWPVGAARVRVRLDPRNSGGCEITMGEEIAEGPFRSLPKAAQATLFRPRNNESLNRLVDLAEGRGPHASRPS